ncbi:hypothetical protein HPT25_03600 [Bacillus sp. BRMEA1]|uniref:hypothetical protein n=1 Tax=Neobacillus endophyticus TaxID=2738405 RepID=UPI0015665C86|nr:hypothetical protein [Neobacillus endophyticus]NRD76575.1 hypothetical protein [Neobacillus endophyticus]
MRWFDKFFSLFRFDYVLIYTAIGDEDCIKMIGKLNENGIPYKTKVRGIYAGRKKRDLGFDTKLSQYDIFVEKGFEHKGRSVINEK